MYGYTPGLDTEQKREREGEQILPRCWILHTIANDLLFLLAFVWGEKYEPAQGSGTVRDSLLWVPRYAWGWERGAFPRQSIVIVINHKKAGAFSKENISSHANALPAAMKGCIPNPPPTLSQVPNFGKVGALFRMLPHKLGSAIRFGLCPPVRK